METERISWIATSYASVHEKYNKRLPSKREKVVWSGSRINLRSINNNKVNGVTVNTPKKYILNLHKISHAQPDQIQLIFFVKKKTIFRKQFCKRAKTKTTHTTLQKNGLKTSEIRFYYLVVWMHRINLIFFFHTENCARVCVCEHVIMSVEKSIEIKCLA